MTQKNYNEDAFISASTLVNVDFAHKDSENKNSVAYSCPELFY